MFNDWVYFVILDVQNILVVDEHIVDKYELYSMLSLLVPLAVIKLFGDELLVTILNKHYH